MTKTEFTSYDFHTYYGGRTIFREDAAECANAKLHEIKTAWLDELKKNAVRVYGHSFIKTGTTSYDWTWGVDPYTSATNTALLIEIQPIKKKCIVHNYNVFKEDSSDLDYRATCDNCGYKLKANWEEV